jgi:hypothetical protein
LRPATRRARNSAIASADRLARFLLTARAVRNAIGLVLLLSACAITGEGSSPDHLTSVDGNQAVIDFDGFVDVAPGASDAVAKDAIHRELKSALGALREQGIGIADRDAQRNLATMTLTRQPMQILGGGSVDRVRYHYHDTALVERGHSTSATIDLTMLFGDYVARAAELIPICSDDQTTDADSLWYHYQPKTQYACAQAIRTEQQAIDRDRQQLTNVNAQITPSDANRRFLATRATLSPVAGAPDKWPEYDQLWGVAGDPSRQKIVVYSFFGVNADESDPHDDGLVEYLRFERELRRRMPNLRVTETNPQAMLLDFYLDGQKLPNITWDDVERWVVDGTGFPTTDAAKQADLLRQVQRAFSERWIVWTEQATATRDGQTRTMTIEIRTWHGWEDGSDDIRLHARWRYLEAFWNADIFSYTGHSHFGHGPLEPWEYSGANFPNRYQVMLVNSCLSFNYYDEDFLNMHPGGSTMLDVVVNGLPAYWLGMGQATAAYVASVVGGSQWSSWRQVLTAMAVDLPWQHGYDPMRAVNGELDNTFTP